MSDFFRELPLRALGYGYAIGEAIKYVASRDLVDLSYTIGTGFMVIHVIHATLTKSYGSPGVSFMKTFPFELFASALIPTFLVYWICRITWDFLVDRNIRPYWMKRWIPTGMGILIMPFIMMPIDQFMDDVINNVLGG